MAVLNIDIQDQRITDLLVLFRLQKYRVLYNIVNNRSKAPRAMVTHGEGDASWTNISVVDCTSETAGTDTTDVMKIVDPKHGTKHNPQVNEYTGTLYGHIYSNI